MSWGDDERRSLEGEEPDAYFRVSTVEQSRNYGLTEQHGEVAHAIERERTLPLRNKYEDHSSGRSIVKRPAFNRLLKDAQDGLVKLVMVPRTDRYARDEKDFWDCTDRLLKAGARVYFCEEEVLASPENDEWKTQITREVGDAANYSRKLSRRVRRGTNAKRQATGGLGSGPAPFGYAWADRARKLVPVRDWDGARYPAKYGPYPAGGPIGMRLEAIRRYAEGNSVAEIVASMSRDGYRRPAKTPEGQPRPLEHNLVYDFLTNPIVVGGRVHRPTRYEAGQCRPTGETTYFAQAVEPVLPQRDWDLVRTLRGERLKGATGRKPGRHPFVYRDVLRCARCGASFHAHYSQSATGAIRHAALRHAQVLGRKGPCPPLRVHEMDLDPYFDTFFAALTCIAPEVIERGRRFLIQRTKAQPDLLARRSKLLLKLKRMTDDYYEGGLEKEDFQKRRQKIHAQLALLKDVPEVAPPEYLVDQIADAGTLWRTGDTIGRKRLIGQLVKEVRIDYPDGFKSRAGVRGSPIVREIVVQEDLEPLVFAALDLANVEIPLLNTDSSRGRMEADFISLVRGLDGYRDWIRREEAAA